MKHVRDVLMSRKSLFSAALVIGAFAVLYTAVDFSRVWEILQVVDLAVFAAATLLFYVPFLFRGERWRLLLDAAGTPLSRWESTEIIFLSFYMNNIVPAQLGDVYRGHVLGVRKNTSRSQLVGTVFVDRLFDLAALVLGATIFSYILLADRFASVLPYLQIGYGLLAVLAIGVTLLVLTGGTYVPDAVSGYVSRFRNGVRTSVTAENLLPVTLYTAAVYGFVVVRVYLVAQALGLGFSFTLTGFVALFMIFLTVIPFTPAGLGAVEVLTTGALAVVGVAAEEALALVLADRVITFISLLVFGSIAYLFAEKRVI